MTPVELRHAAVVYSDATIRAAAVGGLRRLRAGVDWRARPPL
jgi:hypothetical protein